MCRAPRATPTIPPWRPDLKRIPTNNEVSQSIVVELPVWFITGCSTGFGLERVKQAVEHGHRAVMTARDPAKLEGFGATENVLVLQLDVTRPDQVAAALGASAVRFGAIDVLVNNAGSGYFAAIEEGEEAEVRMRFEVNLFGLNRMIQAVLPRMRERHSGRIVNFSSIGGIKALPAPRPPQRDPVRSRRFVRSLVAGSRPAGNPRDAGRAERVSNRLGRAFGPGKCMPDRQLQGHGRHRARGLALSVGLAGR